MTQRLSPPARAGATEESDDDDESSDELLDELESSEPAAAQNFDMVEMPGGDRMQGEETSSPGC